MINKPLPEEVLSRIKLLVLDSDGVSIPRGTKIVQNETKELYKVCFNTHRITDELAGMINQLRKRIGIVISSGRSLIYLQEMYSKIIGEGTILQAENGNLSLIEGRVIQHFQYNEAYFRKIANIKERVKNLSISGFEPKQFILTIHCPRELMGVYRIVGEEDPEGELKIMWNGEAFDIQKKMISKGKGLERLLKHLNVKKREVIAIGDRINDKELLEVAGIGVSADIEKLEAEYWTKGAKLGGEVLVRYLLDNI